MGKLRCKAGLFAQGRLERYCRDQQRPVNVKKKKLYLGIPGSPLGNCWTWHASLSQQNQTGMRGQRSAKGQWHSCSGNIATLGLTMPCIIFSFPCVLFYSYCHSSHSLPRSPGWFPRAVRFLGWGSPPQKVQFCWHICYIPEYKPLSKTRHGNTMWTLWLYFLPKPVCLCLQHRGMKEPANDS